MTKDETLAIKMTEEQHKIRLISFFFFHDAELCFWKWLPLTKEQSMKFTHNSIDYEVSIDPDYEGTFTFNPDLTKIDRGNTWIGALKVAVEFQVNSKIKDAIDRHDPPDELISKIAPFFSILEDSIRDLVIHSDKSFSFCQT